MNSIGEVDSHLSVSTPSFIVEPVKNGGESPNLCYLGPKKRVNTCRSGRYEVVAFKCQATHAAFTIELFLAVNPTLFMRAKHRKKQSLNFAELNL